MPFSFNKENGILLFTLSKYVEKVKLLSFFLLTLNRLDAILGL